MEWFRLSEYSIGNLTTAILLVVITTYLLAMREKHADTWLITAYIGVLAILLLSYVVRYSLLVPGAARSGQVSNFIVFGVLALVAFAYVYRERTNPLEMRIVLSGYGIAALVVYASNFAQQAGLVLVFDFGAHYYTWDYGLRVSVVTGLGYLWSGVVLLRKTVILSRRGDQRRGLLPHLLRPASQGARSCRSFAVLAFVTLAIAATYGLMSGDVISRDTYSLVFTSGSLIVCLLIYIVYVVNSSQPTSFREKLVGVTLAAVLVVFGMVDNVLVAQIDRRLEQEYQTDAMRAARMVGAVNAAVANEAAVPPRVAYIASGSGDLLYVSSADEAFPSWFAGRTVTDFRRAPRLRMSSGRGSYWYGELEEPESFFFGYDVAVAGARFEVGYSYTDYRLFLHEVELEMALVIVVATVALLVLFPVLFNRSLVRPLNELLEGIARVRRRRMEEPVPVRSMDEIGALALEFNDLSASLREAQSNFQALTENANDGIVIIDASETVRYANRRMARIGGYTLEALVGAPLRSLVPPREYAVVGAKLRNRLAGVDVPATYESTILSATGEAIPVEVTAAPTRWESELADVVVIRDIRERKRAEAQLQVQREQLVEADKLASLGILVASVAHEVSSPNHAIRMHAAFLDSALERMLPVVDQCFFDEQEDFGENSALLAMRKRLPDALQGIDRSAAQIDAVVQDLKGFAKRADRPREPVEVNAVVRTVIGIARKYVEARATQVDLDLAEDLPEVLGQAQRLQQVLLNLVQNAVQALGEGSGRIAITTAFTDGRLRISVSDTGAGIAPEHLQRLTEPFFTTRGDSGGTGLGLSISREIVEEHGGSLEFESAPGEGTTVRIALPAIERDNGG